MDLSIIIVNWNSSAYLEKCLDSVYANTRGLSFEVIVVDNASFDGCGEMLARRFPKAKFIQSQVNMGFSGANNRGFGESSGRNLLFLNPDTEVSVGALPAMLTALERTPHAGVIGARLLNSDGSVQSSCIQKFPSFLSHIIDTDFLRTSFPRLRCWGSWHLYEKQSGPVAVDMISGACMMVRRSSFEKVGLFSTDYFMYAEDLDLCFKFYQAGFRNHYLDQAAVVHHGGVSSSAAEMDYISTVLIRDSVWKFFSLRHGRRYAMAYRTTVVLASMLRCSILGGILMLTLGRCHRVQCALFKWAAVFRWGIGIASYTKLLRAHKQRPLP